VRLMPHLDFVFLASGEQICAVGESNHYVYFPETAVVSDISDLEDGNTIETAMIGRDGASGLCAVFGASPPQRRAQTTIKGTAWRIKTETLKQEFARAGTLQTALLDYVNLHIRQISQRLVCKSFHLIEKRLCSWLLMLHDRVENNRLKMTQERAALLLGANRPTITIAAQMLRQKGFINYSRGGIKILDRRGLEDSACECYNALRLDQ
jgi:CRP-like cAMP-binding protein